MAEIKKIVLQVNKKEIELTLGEAKELKRILLDLFGITEQRYIPTYPVYPITIYKEWYRPYEIWCSKTSGDVFYLSDGTVRD